MLRWRQEAADPEITARRAVKGGRIREDALQGELSKGIGKDLLAQIRASLRTMSDWFERAGNVRGEALCVSVQHALVDRETGERGFLVTV